MSEPLLPSVHHLRAAIQFAESGIVSKTLYQSPALKLVLFCFEPGQALSEHTAPFEAVVLVLEGSGDLQLGGTVHEAKAGALFVMPAGLNHAITARERLVFLLTMVKAASPVTIR